MNDITGPTKGKILVHHSELGNMTQADIERRARELALIDGRREISARDRVQAERELRGETLPPTGDIDATSSRGRNRDPSEPVSHLGKQTPDREGTDEAKIPERLVLEGVEEAQHEQMLAARSRRHSSS